METGRSRLLLTNLLNDLETLCRLLVDQLAKGDLLNSYLLAAGAHQIADDYLHRDPLLLTRGAAKVQRILPARTGRVVGRVMHLSAKLIWRVSTASPGDRRSLCWLAELEGLLSCLATGVVDQCCSGEASLDSGAEPAAARLLSLLPTLPEVLRRELVRPPACFRSFDLVPEDMGELVRRFAARWPQRDLPLTVVGVRSSGSYLGPLVMAFLRRLGYLDMIATTMRPGQPWLRHEARLLRDRAGSSGMALLVDNPPSSWGSAADTALQLQRLGFRQEEIVLLLPTFPATAEPPAPLLRYPAVLLPFEEWAIARRLQPETVHQMLSELLRDRCRVLAVRPGLLAPAVERAHANAVFDVTVEEGGKMRRIAVRTRGVGLGYLGEHSLAVAERLSGWLPELYGLKDGVLYEAWDPPELRLREPLTEGQAKAVADYVVARRHSLPLDEDLSARISYRGAAWLWAGRALGGLFGRASELCWPLCAALTRQILEAEAPTVIDAQVELERFALSPDGGRPIKADYDTGVFGSLDLFCFDPALDLAQASVTAGDRCLGEQLRREYEAAAGQRLEPERWFLYQLIRAIEVEARLPLEQRQAARRLAPLFQRYYGEVLLEGMRTRPRGPVCALDVDGVLESIPLGFATISPLGALILRSLIAHGYRPVIATGRSLGEVQDRCLAYGLAGGVAEYGAVTYDRQHGRTHVLIGDRERMALDRLRTVLVGVDGVHLDADYGFSVRAFRLDSGDRRPLDPETVEQALALAATDGLLQPVQGGGQTDFAVASVDKGSALRSLADDLDGVAPGERFLAFAMGDTASDLTMLRRARAAYAPSNADRTVKLAGVNVLSRPFQRGLADAVTDVLGHAPGGCVDCAPPPLPARTRLLLQVLGVQDVAGLQKAASALALLSIAVRLGVKASSPSHSPVERGSKTERRLRFDRRLIAL